MITDKVCPACKTSKPVRDFYRRTASADGLQRTCKPCQHEQWSVNKKTYAPLLVRGSHTDTIYGKLYATQKVTVEDIWYSMGKKISKTHCRTYLERLVTRELVRANRNDSPVTYRKL